MTRHWSQLIDGVISEPDAQIASLRLLSDAERRQVVEAWNDTATPVAGPLTLHGRFETQAAATPDAVAVVDAQRSLTYGELNQLATNVAGRLRRRGIVSGARVGIAVERSVNMVAALLGILKAGAAYVPLNPSFPRDRLAYMVEDSGVAVVITDNSRDDDQTAKSSPNLLHLEACLQSAGDPVGDVAATADGEAYVIYTSGSTGQPKGVVIPHRAAASMLHAFRSRFDMTNDDRWLALTTLSFDISVLEIFGPLSSGASVFVASTQDAKDGFGLVALLEAWQPSFVQATPTTWQMVLESGWSGSPDTTLLVGGESLPSDLAARLRPRCGRLFNVYGPTETTVWATAAEIQERCFPNHNWSTVGQCHDVCAR